MVGPHAGKFYIVHIVRFQEAILQSLMKARLAIIPVPVPNKHINTALLTKLIVDFPCGRFTFIQFAQQRSARLLVTIKPGTCTSDQIVLRPPLCIEFIMQGRRMIIRKSISGNSQTLRLFQQVRISGKRFQVIRETIDFFFPLFLCISRHQTY